MPMPLVLDGKEAGQEVWKGQGKVSLWEALYKKVYSTEYQKEFQF